MKKKEVNLTAKFDCNQGKFFMRSDGDEGRKMLWDEKGV